MIEMVNHESGGRCPPAGRLLRYEVGSTFTLWDKDGPVYLQIRPRSQTRVWNPNLNLQARWVRVTTGYVVVPPAVVDAEINKKVDHGWKS